MDRPARVIHFAVLAVLSCGGGAPQVDEGDRGKQVMYRRLVLSLELLPTPPRRGEEDAGGSLDLWLIETDETGSTKRVDLGQLPGPCTVRKNPPGVAMKPLFALECTGGAGLRARLVYQRDQLIVLRAPGVTGDDFDLEESHRVSLPIGVRVLTE
ncbi:MAG TPA: hypothetical protein VNO33_13430 [Kofleriaceae bacterium]|nr:hypothetical protein [Kofleriaceae bacterium]